MRNLLMALFIFALASTQLPIAVANPQVPLTENKPKRLSVALCDLIQKPEKYNGAVVVVQADVLDGQGHGILLTHKGCSKGLAMLTDPQVDQEKVFADFYQWLYSNRRNVPESQIRARFEGRFCFRPTEPRLKWALEVQRITNIETLQSDKG